jgi:hypothetical protein
LVGEKKKRVGATAFLEEAHRLLKTEVHGNAQD